MILRRADRLDEGMTVRTENQMWKVDRVHAEAPERLGIVLYQDEAVLCEKTIYLYPDDLIEIAQ